MRPFRCSQCGQTVFFENTHCGQCGAQLGYLPSRRDMLALPSDTATSRAATPQACAHREQHGFCNWLVEDGQPLCVSCRLTRTVPNLEVDGNLQAWARIEQAKQRLVVTLIALGLSPTPKRDADDAWGLVFDLGADLPDQPLLTGHANGVITLNIAEADDVRREAARVAFDEPMRTLLGHLRHEIGHYLQYRWLSSDAQAMTSCREVFGDEQLDYTQALQRHHADGPPPDWRERFISAYASAHPWEDWAETCAHTLLVIDAVETAAAWGLRLASHAARARPEAATTTQDVEDLVLTQWLPVAQFLNAMNRSLGLRDSYPFLMPDAVLRKMNVVRTLLRRAAAGDTAAPAQSPPSQTRQT